VEELLRIAAASLERGPADLDALAALGVREPARAAAALERARTHPDLAPTASLWLPELLLTARPGFGAHALEELAQRYRDTRHRPLPLTGMPGLARVLASSDALARVLLHHPHWSEELIGDPPAPPSPAPPEPDWTALRIAKYRGLLRIAARDLLGRESFAESLAELSGLADRCLSAGLERAARELDAEPPSLLALGKLGGAELNFSSDVDLLFLYDGGAGAFDAEAHTRLIQLVQLFKKHMEVPSEDGFAYRVDLDLRPQGTRGDLVHTVNGALDYYENFGAEWERQALIRLRHIAGPPEPAHSFAQQVRPFVYRRLVSPDSVRAVHLMKLRIEAERRRSGRDLESDLKEGPGGIRDLEFLVQAIQLFAGGREPSLQTGNVLEALGALERLRLLPRPVTASLAQAYLWLRRAEHAVQMVEERQTAAFPREPAAQIALARRMGYRDAEGERARQRLLADGARVRAEVRQHFEALVLESRFEARRAASRSLEEQLAEALRGTPLFSRLSTSAAPFLERRSDDPAARRLEPPIARGLARLVTSNAAASRYLALRPELLDRIARADPATLEQRSWELRVAEPPGTAADLEGFLDALRLERRDDTLLAACLDLAGLVPFEEVSRFLSLVAETCVRWALDVSSAAAGRDAGLCVLGMGKLAGREFTYQSDLDLIFLYPDEIADPSLPARTAQRLIHCLATPTGAGVAYAVDARLRPSGGQGLLVTPFASFERYQVERAATWEHLALMRSRAIAGDVARAQSALERTRARVLEQGHSPWTTVAEMGARVRRERGTERPQVVPFKTGRGGLMQVDFLAAGGMLERGLQLPDAQPPSVPAMLRAAAPGPRTEALLQDYALLRRVEASARWVSDRAVEELRLSGESAPLSCELVEAGSTPASLRPQLVAARGRVHQAWDAVLEAGSIGALGGEPGA
jgi:glutamate-ammonia-ligase adenylyltransferase